jgi:hypothetical protein
MKRFMNKKVATIGLAAGCALGGAGAAFAYFTTTGLGTGTVTGGTASALTLHATIAGPILPGDGGQDVTFTADNPSTGTQFVTTISFGSVTSTNTTCQTFLSANAGQFSMADVTSDSQVAGGATGAAITGTGTLIWANESYAQNACAGASLTLHVTSD